MASSSETFKPERIRHLEVDYERTDLSHRAVFAFLLLLVVAFLPLHLAIWAIFKDLGKSEYAGHQTTNPIATSNEQLKEIGGDPALSFPMPRLQPNPIADLNKFRIAEEQELNSYGWVDRNAARIHIPIDQAIDLMSNNWQQQQSLVTGGQAATASTAPEEAKRPGTDIREGNYGW